MVKKLVVLLCLCVPVSGCVPAVVVVGATVGAAAIYEKRSFKTISKDNHATMSATNTIRKDKALNGKGHVKVAVFNGIGLVVGETTDQQSKDEVGKIVASTPNIRRVYNEVSIEGSNSGLSRVNDTWLAGKVRTSLLVKPGLRSTNVKVIAESGTVYLMGLVTHSQAKLATNAARDVSGVKKVVKVFEYE